MVGVEEGVDDVEDESDLILRRDSFIRSCDAILSASNKETSRRARRRRRSSCACSKRLIRASRSAITSITLAGLFHW